VPAPPVKRDEEVELQIDSLAYGGNGVARLDGFVVFVRRGLPGDRVRARITKVQRRHAEAVTTAVVEPGPVRVDYPCRHYPTCGGCRFQDLAYDAQLAAKHAWVGDSLTRIAGIAEPPLEPIVGAEEIFHYRNKMEYSFAQTHEGPTLGLHVAGRWDTVLEIEECWLTSDLGNRIRNTVREWGREERLPAFDQATGEGYLRHLVVREGVNTRQALVQLVTHKRERFDRERLIEVLTAIPEVRSIHWSINETPAEVTNLPTELLWGEEAIEEELGGLRFRVRPNAFLQTNTRMAERLYELAREAAGLTGGETVYDLYCGIGTIGLTLAADALTVWGIEISEESVACAIENAELNGIGNAAFFAGNVGQVLQELRDRAGDPDVVLVDPPRAGLAGKALKRLGELAAPRIVYVSCNPTTLAGDAKRLIEEYGYALRRTTPVDMFPHTPHVESVSVLEARTRAGPSGSA
jgi:23S rRNA (uracil1939-C5)-methyltransferase